jgi:hypothetical protein
LIRATRPDLLIVDVRIAGAVDWKVLGVVQSAIGLPVGLVA